MFKEERKALLLKYIIENKRVQSSVLQQHFHVSLMTVNRLLKELHDEGKITKFHGGASSRININVNGEFFVDKKYMKNYIAKQKIAEYATKNFIQKNEIYFFGAGSTVHAMMSFIKDESITIITNGIYVVQVAARVLPALNMICSGGVIRPRSMSFVGNDALAVFKKFRAHTLFISSHAVSTLGPMDPDSLEIAIKKEMIEHSDRVVLLADSSKMNTSSAELVIDFSKVSDVISEKVPPKSMLEALRKNKVQFHFAE